MPPDFDPPAPRQNYDPPGRTLSVSDVERLAKAGVKIEFSDVRYQIMPDDDLKPPERLFPHMEPLQQSFWERWRRANPQKADRFDHLPPFSVYAHETDDKVFVMVGPNDTRQEPFLIEDLKHLYPSDALMAKLHLWLQARPK